MSSGCEEDAPCAAAVRQNPGSAANGTGPSGQNLRKRTSGFSGPLHSTLHPAAYSEPLKLVHNGAAVQNDL